MDVAHFRCRCCGKIKVRRSPEQRYCGEAVCQRARKQAWRRAKYASDPDYRLNQKQSTAAWLAKRGGAATYFRDYRRRRRDEKQCELPKIGVAKASPPTSANSDATLDESPIASGRYRLVPLEGANSDAISVQLSVIQSDLAALQISTP
jgi:hypothetical protein